MIFGILKAAGTKVSRGNIASLLRVNFNLEEAMKAQRGSSGTVILFI
jgi:hypothetical protein